MKTKQQLFEDKVRQKVKEELMAEENPNYRKQADLKYSDRNKFLIDRTKQLFDDKYAKELNNLLNEVMDVLRDKLTVKDISYGRTAGSDVKVIRTQLKKSIFEFMKNWTD